MDHDRLAAEVNRLALAGQERLCRIGSFIMQDNFKYPLVRHSGVLPLYCPQSQLPLGILPMDRDSRKCAVFVIILVALILVKLEGSIQTGEDVQFNRRVGQIIHMLADRAHRQDGSGAHINRQPIDGSVRLDRLAARIPFPTPEVIPVNPGGQVDLARLGDIFQRP